MSVIGANVVVKGTTNGVITDLDGNFILQANPGDIIVVSYIGYLSQEVPASDKLIKITLSEDNEMLDEVVVIGYGSVKKNDLTGSVTAIKAEEINRGVVTSPDQMLYANPNEKIIYNKRTRKLSLEKTSTKAETAWIGEELVFRHEPLREVFRCLERRFGVTFSVNDTTFRNDAYTGVFREKNVEDVLDILRQHYGFKYEREGDEISIQMK